MFEKDAEEYKDNTRIKDKNTYISFPDESISELQDYEGNYIDISERIIKSFKDGAEFGYNKANEWHYVSEKGLPKESGRYLVYVGGDEKGVYPLDFETEYNDFGYWCLIINSASLGVTDTVFETITERNEDKVIAWKEIVLPKESE